MHNETSSEMKMKRFAKRIYELISGEPYYGNETDVWSLGVVLYALLCGFLPFDHENTAELYKKIKKGNFAIPPWLSARSLSLLKDMLQVNPKKRISIQNILTHEWLTTGYSEPVQWKSTFQRKKLNGKVVRLLSEFYHWTTTETEKKIIELKYNNVTAIYFILTKMSEQKLRKFRSTWLLGSTHSGERIYNNILDVPGQIKANGHASSSYRPRERERSSTMDSPTLIHPETLHHTDESLPYSSHRRRSKTMDTIKKELASVTLISEPENNNIESNLDTRERSRTNEPMIVVSGTKHERSQTLTSKYSNYVNTTDILQNRFAPIKGNHPHSSNLHGTKRLAASCMDSINIVNIISKSPSQQTVHKTQSLGRPLENSLKEEKRPRTRSMKDFTQRLSGFFKQINGPRRVKAIYHVENTSVLSADDVRNELERVLTLLVSKEVLSSFTNPDRFLFKCKSAPDKKTKFELEICLIPFMDNVVGIRRKRLKGDGWKYKEIVEYILSIARI